MVDKGIGLLAVLVIIVNIIPAFAMTELERTSIMDPRLENTSRSPIIGKVNVNQQIQISADITNHQTKSQNFVYLVQIKNDVDLVVSLGWISGQLTPDQKLSPSLSWAPINSGEYVAEVFVWEGLKNHSALSEQIELTITVS